MFDIKFQGGAVPVPASGRVIVFADALGRIKKVLPSGLVSELEGEDGAPGAPGLLSSVRISGININVVGQAAPGLLIHGYEPAISLVGRRVGCRAMLLVNSAGNVNIAARLIVGGVACLFPSFGSNGARAVFLDVECVAYGGANIFAKVCQGSSEVGSTASMVSAGKLSSSGSLLGSLIELRLDGALSKVNVQGAIIEVSA